MTTRNNLLTAQLQSTSGGRIRADLLIFDGGNEWASSAPFFDIPSWWRRFVFRILTPRDFMVYCYIVSYCGRRKVAHPLIKHMKADLNISNSSVIYDSLKRLVDLGFLLKSQRVFRLRLCNVYQRPCAEFTLLRLLSKEVIDGNLVPTKPGKRNAVHRDAYTRTLGSVASGLRNLLGNDLYTQWNAVSDADKADELFVIVAARLKEKRQRYVEEAAKPGASDLLDERLKADAAKGFTTEAAPSSMPDVATVPPEYLELEDEEEEDEELDGESVPF